MEAYDLVDALLAHQGQRHSKSSQQTSETCLIRGKPHYGIFSFITETPSRPDPHLSGRLGRLIDPDKSRRQVTYPANVLTSH